MLEIREMLKELGLKVTSIKEASPFTLDVYFVDGYNDFYTKYFFTGPKGNFVSRHNGKFVLPITLVGEGYTTGKLVEKDSYYLFKPLPKFVDIDSVQYSIRYKKDVWGF